MSGDLAETADILSGDLLNGRSYRPRHFECILKRDISKARHYERKPMIRCHVDSGRRLASLGL